MRRRIIRQKVKSLPPEKSLLTGGTLLAISGQPVQLLSRRERARRSKPPSPFIGEGVGGEELFPPQILHPLPQFSLQIRR